MTLLTGNDAIAREKLRAVKHLPPGPRRLEQLCRLLRDDVQRIPTEEMPERVRTALDAFHGALQLAELAIKQREDSETALAEAARADTAAIAAALLGKGSKPRNLRRTAAKVEATISHVTTEAAEVVVGQRHTELIEAVREAWPTWRATLVEQAEARREAALLAALTAQKGVEAAAARFEAVGLLDGEMVRRHADLKRIVDAEQRDGILWYAATHTGAPLRTASVKDSKGNAAAVPLANVLEGLCAALEPKSCPSFEWRPPSDPDHDRVKDTPLGEQRWLASALIRERGSTCEVCFSPKADTVMRIDGRLALAHEWCKNRKPDERERRRQERLARMSREGFPAQPGVDIHDPESGRVFRT